MKPDELHQQEDSNKSVHISIENFGTLTLNFRTTNFDEKTFGQKNFRTRSYAETFRSKLTLANQKSLCMYVILEMGRNGNPNQK